MINQATDRSIILWSAMPEKSSLNALHTQDLAWLDKCSGLACDIYTYNVGAIIMVRYKELLLKILNCSYITVVVVYIAYYTRPSVII